ncbi:MAG: prepilin-type cleavage/methylation domain-containing protein [Verrucomicrobiota bacterium]|jgi:hypothetical protein
MTRKNSTWIAFVLIVVMAAIAIPNFRSRTYSSPNACVENLRIIDAAKHRWAKENHKQNTDTPAASDIQPYLGRGSAGELPVCPVDPAQTFTTSYSINNMATKPTCKIWPATHICP